MQVVGVATPRQNGENNKKNRTPEIQKRTGLKGMPVCENSMVKESHMVFFFHTKLH